MVLPVRREIEVPAASDDERPASVPQASASLDARAVITAWSAGAHELLGHAPDEAIGTEAKMTESGPPPGTGAADCSDRCPVSGAGTKMMSSTTVTVKHPEPKVGAVDGTPGDSVSLGLAVVFTERRPTW